MRRRGIAFLTLSGLLVGVLAVASCGRYGKPVRSAPEPDPQEHAQSAEKR